jgi:hypothetical protein
MKMCHTRILYPDKILFIYDGEIPREKKSKREGEIDKRVKEREGKGEKKRERVGEEEGERDREIN